MRSLENTECSLENTECYFYKLFHGLNGLQNQILISKCQTFLWLVSLTFFWVKESLTNLYAWVWNVTTHVSIAKSQYFEDYQNQFSRMALRCVGQFSLNSHGWFYACLCYSFWGSPWCFIQRCWNGKKWFDILLIHVSSCWRCSGSCHVPSR
mgnify:CR=1 FL=1